MDVLKTLQDLIAFDSVSTSSNQAISDYVESFLNSHGFVIERIEYQDSQGVTKVNLVGKKGVGTGGFAYFAHTDVVPADDWLTGDPFVPQIRDQKIWGRGSCDMKGSLACMLTAVARFSQTALQQPIYVTCTADEEIGFLGAAEVVQHSTFYREMVSGDVYAVIGEPTTLDVIHAHKGIYVFQTIASGRAAHSATHEGVNANLAMIPFLAQMKQIYEETESNLAWQNPDFDPPTISWNIGIQGQPEAINMTAAQSRCQVSFRPMPGQDGKDWLKLAADSAKKLGLTFEALCQAEPIYSDPQSQFIQDVLETVEQHHSHTVSYGTDACLFNALKNIVILGPGDIAQAHTNQEWISQEQLERGTEIYSRLIEKWCC